MYKDKIKFIKKTAVFWIIFLLILIFLNGLYNYSILYKKKIYRNEQQYEQNFENVKVMIFGDSHAADALNPEFIKESFNYAVGGETYGQTYYKVRKILNDHDDIKAIILPLDLHSFSEYRSNPYIDIKYWTNFMTIDELVRETGKSKTNIYINKIFPFIGNGIEYLQISFNQQITPMYKGWQKITGSIINDNNKDQAARDRVNLQFKHSQKFLAPANINALESILILAQTKNVKVILIKFPVSKYYLEEVSKFGINREEFYSEIENKIGSYDNVYVLDFQTKYNDELFSNVDHLNEEGAEIFSKEINRDLEKIMEKKLPDY